VSDELAEAQAEASRHDAECRALEDAIARLRLPGTVVPGTTHRTPDGRVALETHGVDVHRYEPTELGSTLARRDVLAARAEYLRERWQELNGRAERTMQARERAAAGVSRFSGGRFTLDRITAATAAMPAALAELRRQRTRGADIQLREELERIGDTKL
jgi:hypothetical protein